MNNYAMYWFGFSFGINVILIAIIALITLEKKGLVIDEILICDGISFSRKKECFMVYGFMVSPCILSHFAINELGSWHRIETRNDGVIQISSASDQNSRAFDLICGKGRVAG